MTLSNLYAEDKTKKKQYYNVKNLWQYERIKGFKYLGTTWTADSDITTEIKQRIITANEISYGLKKRPNSPNWKSQTKGMLYKTLIRPMLRYGSECLPLWKDGNMLRIFEIIIMRMIYSPVNDNGIWRTRYNNELYTLYDELDIIKVTKTGRLRWLG